MLESSLENFRFWKREYLRNMFRRRVHGMARHYDRALVAMSYWTAYNEQRFQQAGLPESDRENESYDFVEDVTAL